MLKHFFKRNFQISRFQEICDFRLISDDILPECVLAKEEKQPSAAIWTEFHMIFQKMTNVVEIRRILPTFAKFPEWMKLFFRLVHPFCLVSETSESVARTKSPPDPSRTRRAQGGPACQRGGASAPARGPPSRRLWNPPTWQPQLGTFLNLERCKGLQGL